MENFVCINPASQHSSPLSFHKSSHTISKTTKPKVRIIHIFAPEIIKTDVANFRELVQRLTGKPTARDKTCRKNRPRSAKRPSEEIIAVGGENPAANGNRLMEFRRGFPFLTREESVVKEEVMWHSNGDQSYLNGFGDFDGLIQELGHDQFNFFPNLDGSHLHGFEQAHQLTL